MENIFNENGFLIYASLPENQRNKQEVITFKGYTQNDNILSTSINVNTNNLKKQQFIYKFLKYLEFEKDKKMEDILQLIHNCLINENKSEKKIENIKEIEIIKQLHLYSNNSKINIITPNFEKKNENLFLYSKNFLLTFKDVLFFRLLLNTKLFRKMKNYLL